MNTYAIHESNLERLQKKIKRIENKCKKYGCEFHYAEIGEEVREYTSEDGTSFPTRYIIVEAEGTAKVNGWSFAATLQHEASGNIIRKYRDDIEIPQRYYACEPTCEHCKSARHRKNTFIVYNDETQEFKQVGSGCLCDFTGGLSAEAIAEYLSFFDTLVEGEAVVPGLHVARYFDLATVLSYAVSIIKKTGYISASSAMRDETTTRQAVRAFYEVDVFRSSSKIDQNIIDDLNKKFDITVDHEANKAAVEDVINYFKSVEEDNDYMHNLKVLANSEYVAYDKLGYVVSMIPTYNRYVEKKIAQAERERKTAAEAASSNFVGKEGERITFNPVSTQIVTYWETIYGLTQRVKFVDAEGNVFMWDSSSAVDPDKKIESIKGTVKKHDEWNGIKQTWMTRCRVTYAPENPKKAEPAPATNEVQKAFEEWYDALDAM